MLILLPGNAKSGVITVSTREDATHLQVVSLCIKTVIIALSYGSPTLADCFFF